MKEELKKEVLELVKEIANNSNRLYEIMYKESLLLLPEKKSENIRQCNKCGEFLSIDHFYPSQTHRPHVTCKDCYREYEKKYRIKKQIELLNQQLKKLDPSLKVVKNE